MRRVAIAVMLIAGMGVSAVAQKSAPQKPATTLPNAPSASAASSSEGKLPSQATVNSFLKQMFGYEQNLTWNVTGIKRAEDSDVAEVDVVFSSPQGQQGVRFFVTPDGKHAVLGDMVPFGADPFAQAREALKGATGGFTKGAANAPLAIVEFGDLECPSCKAAQPTIEKLLGEYPNAKLVFYNYPIEQLHPWAMLAAKYVDCIGREKPDALWAFIDAVYANQTSINEQNAAGKLGEYAQGAGVDPKATASCADQAMTYQRVLKSIDLAKQVGVTGTPTLFVNGRKLPSVTSAPYDAVKSIVDFEAEKSK